MNVPMQPAMQESLDDTVLGVFRVAYNISSTPQERDYDRLNRGIAAVTKYLQSRDKLSDTRFVTLVEILRNFMISAYLVQDLRKGKSKLLDNLVVSTDDNVVSRGTQGTLGNYQQFVAGKINVPMYIPLKTELAFIGEEVPAVLLNVAEGILRYYPTGGIPLTALAVENITASNRCFGQKERSSLEDNITQMVRDVATQTAAIYQPTCSFDHRYRIPSIKYFFNPNTLEEARKRITDMAGEDQLKRQRRLIKNLERTYGVATSGQIPNDDSLVVFISAALGLSEYTVGYLSLRAKHREYLPDRELGEHAKHITIVGAYISYLTDQAQRRV